MITRPYYTEKEIFFGDLQPLFILTWIKPTLQVEQVLWVTTFNNKITVLCNCNFTVKWYIINVQQPITITTSSVSIMLSKHVK